MATKTVPTATDTLSLSSLIPMTVAMPAKPGWYLVFGTKSETDVNIFDALRFDGRSFRNDRGGIVPVSRYSHWSPLPHIGTMCFGTGEQSWKDVEAKLEPAAPEPICADAGEWYFWSPMWATKCGPYPNGEACQEAIDTMLAKEKSGKRLAS